MEKKEYLQEIYLERARYLLNADDTLEEMLAQENISTARKVEIGGTAASEAVKEESD